MSDICPYDDLLEETILAWSNASTWEVDSLDVTASGATKRLDQKTEYSIDDTDFDAKTIRQTSATTKPTAFDYAEDNEAERIRHAETADATAAKHSIAEQGVSAQTSRQIRGQVMQLADLASRRRQVSNLPSSTQHSLTADRNTGPFESAKDAAVWFFDNTDIIDEAAFVRAVDEPLGDEELMVVRSKAQLLILHTAEFISVVETRYKVFQTGKGAHTVENVSNCLVGFRLSH
jgi:hypothetical protein